MPAPRHAKNRYSRLALALLFASAYSLFAAAQAQPDTIMRFRQRTPLGSESILVRPANVQMRFYATLESTELDNATVVSRQGRKMLLSSEGREIVQYPREFTVRFTATLRNRVDDPDPLPYDTKLSPAELAAALHFRLKIFHGIDAQTYEPVEARMIGVPADQPYDERIYLVKFRTAPVPAEDRMMFEVLNGEQERITKFGIQFY